MIHANQELAARLERVSAALAFDSVAAHRALYPDSTAEAVPFAGGAAVFLDEQSPLTQISGAGLSGAVTDTDVEEMEAFFDERTAPVSVGLTPFADAGLWTRLSRRGYEIGAFENTLVRMLSAEDALYVDPDVEEAADGEEWSHTLSQAFFGDVSAMGLTLGRTLHAMPTARNLIIRAGEEPAAGAQVHIRDGVGVLQCDVTLEKFRGVGLQTKLIRARMALAAQAGCDLVTADTLPGSGSQRNYERLGFQVVYTKLTLIKPCF